MASALNVHVNHCHPLPSSCCKLILGLCYKYFRDIAPRLCHLSPSAHTMSCSLCRLPFTPSDQAHTDRFPPKNVLSEKQILYMNHAIGMGHLVGVAMNMKCSGERSKH